MRPMGAVYGWGEEPLTAASGVPVVAGVAILHSLIRLSC